MRVSITLMVLGLCLYGGIARAAFVSKWATAQQQAQANNVTAQQSAAGMNAFLNMDRKSYEELTGKRMSFKEALQFKAAQKMMKKQAKKAGGGTLPQWAYIVLSIFLLGWLAIGIKSNWQSNDWWISLLLYILFWVPGLIYSLVVMSKYY
jgi:uncharacterized membrane protein YqaE (UPF0057 family)